MSSLKRAREFFAKDIYATKTTGIVIEDVKENYARCSLKITDAHKNAVGQVMGGVMFTIADFAFAVATNFDKDAVTVTTVSQISYLGTVKGDTLYAEAKLIKDGKTVCFYEVSVFDNEGNSVALVNCTGTHIQK